jgi:hypothetical protein
MALGEMKTTHVDAVLNAALVAADIASGYEEYLNVIDRFYADDVEAACEGCDRPIVGTSRLTATLTSGLLPLHGDGGDRGIVRRVAIGGENANRCSRQNPERVDARVHGSHGITLLGFVVLPPTWRGAKVVSEFHYNHQQTGAPLRVHDLRCSSDGTRAPF